MTTLGSLTFADGGIQGYERVGDTVHMSVHGYTSEYMPSNFVLMFRGVTEVEDADRWHERIGKEELGTDNGQQTLTLFNGSGEVMFRLSFASVTITEGGFATTAAAAAFGFTRGAGSRALGESDAVQYPKRLDLVYWIGTALIVMFFIVMAAWSVFHF